MTVTHEHEQSGIPMSRDRSSYKLLGSTHEARGSEIQAAARAELIPTAETRALSSPAGRVFARLARSIGINQSLQNYLAFRPFGMIEMLKRAIPPGITHPHILDPVAGYTPQMIWLAQQMPNAHVYEVDMPEVISDKAQRLRNGKGVVIPQNLTWYGENLRETPLSKVLDEKKMHVIIAMSAFLRPAEYVRLLRYLGENLTADGTIVGTIPWQAGMDALARVSLLYRVQVGPLPGVVDNVDVIYERYRDAGFSDITITSFPELARELGYPEPADIERLVLAKR
jgi:hypothetical protein